MHSALNILIKTFFIAGIYLFTGCQNIYQPLTIDQQKQQLKVDLAALFAAKPVPEAALSLEHAMARALTYNLDHQVQLLESSITRGVADLSRFQQLPRLDLFADHIHRDRATTFDQDREQTTANLSLAWNILDFGVSYIRSRQKANEALAAQERLIKSANKLAIKTHRVFWRAYIAEQLAGDIEPLKIKLKKTLDNVRIAEQRRLQPPMELLDYQKTLLEMIAQIQRLQTELASAKSTLAKLIHSKPGSKLKLLSPPLTDSLKARMPPIEKLEQYALLNRPELREASYQQRIKTDDTRKAMLRMLPGLEFSIGENYNSGSSYTNNVWADAGVQLTWNLMNLFSAPRAIALSKHREQLQELRRLALHISVLSQVHLAYRNLLEARHTYSIASDLSDVSTRIFTHASAGRQAVSLSEQELIKRQVDQVLYKVRKLMAYADLEEARGELYLSLGQSVVPVDSTNQPITQLTAVIKNRYKELRTGNLAGLNYSDYEVFRPDWLIELPKSESHGGI